MKILIASDHNLTAVNGIVTSVINLKSGLEKEGHEVRVLTLSEDCHARRIRSIYYLGAFHIGFVYPGAKFAFPLNRKTIREILEWEPDLIHSQTEFSVYTFVHYLSRKAGIPVVHTYHTLYENYLHYFPPIKLIGVKRIYRIVRRIYGQSSAFIVPTRKIELTLNQYGISGPMKIIPTGIDTALFSDEYAANALDIRIKYGLSDRDFVLICLGRIAREKNIEELIDYVGSSPIPNIRLIIAGDGPHLKNLKQICKKQNEPDRYIFTGVIEPQYTPYYYCLADVFVNASTSETQGLTYMEAMACSLPVLCRKDSCMDGVITNKKNGFLYNTKEEFLRYAEELALNPDRRKSVGAAARKTICEHYSSEAFIKSCEDIYYSVLDLHGRKKMP